MAEFTSSKLDADSHLLLDQPLLRLPTELLRKTLKSAQRQIEMTNKNITSATQSFNPQASPADTLASLDATLAKAQSLKRKLEALHAEEQALHRQQKARINHLQELHSIPTLADVKYDQWSRKRLDRLLVDYLLRQGYTQSAKELAREKNLEELVDIGVFEECGRVERSLIEGRTQECLAWCTDNKQALKKISVSPCTSAPSKDHQITNNATPEQLGSRTSIAAVHRVGKERRHQTPHGRHRACPQASGKRSRRPIRSPSRRSASLRARHSRRALQSAYTSSTSHIHLDLTNTRRQCTAQPATKP